MCCLKSQLGLRHLSCFSPWASVAKTQEACTCWSHPSLPLSSCSAPVPLEHCFLYFLVSRVLPAPTSTAQLLLTSFSKQSRSWDAAPVFIFTAFYSYLLYSFWIMWLVCLLLLCVHIAPHTNAHSRTHCLALHHVVFHCSTRTDLYCAAAVAERRTNPALSFPSLRSIASLSPHSCCLDDAYLSVKLSLGSIHFSTYFRICQTATDTRVIVFSSVAQLTMDDWCVSV